MWQKEVRIMTPRKVRDAVFILDGVDYGKYVITEFRIGTSQELRVFANCGISEYQVVR